MLKIITTLFFFLFLTNYSHAIETKELILYDNDENELLVEVYPSDGDYIQIWLVEHVEQRLMFEKFIEATVNSGIEVWRINLINNYFLPESSASINKLSGHGAASIIAEAIKKTNKKVFISAYDRMGIVALKGMYHWHASLSPNSSDINQLLGAVLFYPLLYQPQEFAGLAPDIEPIVSHTNLPVVMFQPENGSHIHYLANTLSNFWAAGSSTFSYIVPGVRDWFFMHAIENENRELRATKQEKFVTALIPEQLHQLLPILDSIVKPAQALTFNQNVIPSTQPTLALKSFPKNNTKTVVDLDFNLVDANTSKVYQGKESKVSIINFWATWCPPCVEEIPSLNKLRKHFLTKYGENQFNLVSIDFQESKSDVLKFLKKIPVDFPVLLDANGNVSKQWNVFALPSSFILDKNGNIRYSINRGIDWNTAEIKKIIDDLINE